MGTRRRVRVGLAVVVTLACMTACAGQGDHGSADSGQGESVSDGDVTVTYSPGVFEGGVTPSVSAADVGSSDFIDAFGLTTASGQAATASVTADSQPTGDVEVSFRLDPGSVAQDEIPAVFYFEPYTGMWLPIPSEYSDDGTLVGTTDHFTDFAAAILSGLDSAEKGAQWLRYQVARAVGARAGGVECSGEWPGWLVNVEVEKGLNAPLPACAEGDDEQLRLRVVNNRPYGMVLDAPVAPSDASYKASLDAEDVVAAGLSGNKPLTFGDDIVIPAGMQVDLYWKRGALDPGMVTINGRVMPATVALDAFYLGALKIAEFVSAPIDLLSAAGSCLQDAFDTASGSAQEAAGALAEAAGACLDPLAEAAGGAAREASKKVLLGVEVGLLMGRGAQTVLDASAALNEPHRIVLSIAEPLPQPPQGGDAQPAQRYANPRFGFVVNVPQGFSENQPGPANGDGASFTSGTATLTVYGENNVFNYTPESAFQDATRSAQRDGTVAYKAQLDDGFAISGTDQDGLIYYERQWVGEQSMNTLWWRYPDGDSALDAMVEASVQSFSPGDLSESH